MTEDMQNPTGPEDHLWSGTDRDASPRSDDVAEPTASQDVTDELRGLAQLRSEGILTDKEFAARKAELLGISGRRGGSRPPRGRRTKIIVAAILALLVLGGGGAAAAVKIKHDNDVATQRKADERARVAAVGRARKAREARERAAADEAKAKRVADHFEISMRRLLVRDLRKSVTKDFKGRVNDGYLDGPILGTTCNPISGGAEDLEETTGKFECLVANERLGGDQVRGYSVDATVNYTKSSYTWQMTN